MPPVSETKPASPEAELDRELARIKAAKARKDPPPEPRAIAPEAPAPAIQVQAAAPGRVWPKFFDTLMFLNIAFAIYVGFSSGDWLAGVFSFFLFGIPIYSLERMAVKFRKEMRGEE